MAEQKLHRGGAPYIAGRYRYASAYDMYALLGVKQLPAEGMPERVIQGVRVYVKPLPPLESIAGTRRRRRFALRVMAICNCGQHMPVGRLHQHKCKTACDHDWQEQPGEPPVDVCNQCGAVRS